MATNPIYHDLENIMMRMGGEWEQLRDESIFITGGTGFFGRWLLESLLLANDEFNLNLKIMVLTRNPAAFKEHAPHLVRNPSLNLYQGDVINFDFPKESFSYFIHGATTSATETFRGEDPLHKFDILVKGTRHVLDFATSCKVKRFLFISSGVAYGAPPVGMDFIVEDYSGAPDPRDVNAALGQAKRTAEFLCAYYAGKYQWSYSVTRCFSFVGPFLPLDIHYAIGNFIKQALFEDSITVKGDGSPIRSYLYMGDLVTWLLTILLDGSNGQIYNVGSDQAISIEALAYLVRDTLSPQKGVHVLGQSTYSVGNIVRNRYVPSIEKARSELGLDVWTSLVDSIRSTAINYL
jgi:dTDP-glucose 4,6-dehydratase/UDP-glucose 4-epimerase